MEHQIKRVHDCQDSNDVKWCDADTDCPIHAHYWGVYERVDDTWLWVADFDSEDGARSYVKYLTVGGGKDNA